MSEPRSWPAGDGDATFHVMSLDAHVASSVACRIAVLGAIGLTGCPRSAAPEAPGPEPTPATVDHRPVRGGGGRSALLGELCTTGAAGRPGLAPLAARTVAWTSEPRELTSPLDRGQTGAFAVLGFDGRRVGLFTALGVGDQAGVAIGSYAGGSPCATAVTPGSPPIDDAACTAATGGCGLALAPISSGGAFAPLAAPEVTTGGACVSGDSLIIDIDGDGVPEGFPLTAFLDGSRAPAEEIPAATAVAGPCPPSFTRYGIAIAVDAAISDPRHRVTLDVLGVLDVDGDDRREVVIGLRYAERRTIAVYSAIDSASRLSRIGEVEPWPQP